MQPTTYRTLCFRPLYLTLYPPLPPSPPLPLPPPAGGVVVGGTSSFFAASHRGSCIGSQSMASLTHLVPATSPSTPGRDSDQARLSRSSRAMQRVQSSILLAHKAVGEGSTEGGVPHLPLGSRPNSVYGERPTGRSVHIMTPNSSAPSPQPPGDSVSSLTDDSEMKMVTFNRLGQLSQCGTPRGARSEGTVGGLWPGSNGGGEERCASAGLRSRRASASLRDLVVPHAPPPPVMDEVRAAGLTLAGYIYVSICVYVCICDDASAMAC